MHAKTENILPAFRPLEALLQPFAQLQNINCNSFSGAGSCVIAMALNDPPPFRLHHRFVSTTTLLAQVHSSTMFELGSSTDIGGIWQHHLWVVKMLSSHSCERYELLLQKSYNHNAIDSGSRKVPSRYIGKLPLCI